MKIGLNLSFAVKRWLEPKFLSSMIRNELETRYIQFTWDLLNPWWPSRQRDKIAREWSQAFKKESLILTGTFGGLASYTYPQLMAPSAEQRKISLDFFKRAIDMSAVMESNSIGTPLGGMTHNDAYNEKKREEIYNIVLDLIRELATYAKKGGIEKIIIPKENEKDLFDIPSAITKHMEIVMAEHMDEVLANALVLKEGDILFNEDDFYFEMVPDKVEQRTALN